MAATSPQSTLFPPATLLAKLTAVYHTLDKTAPIVADPLGTELAVLELLDTTTGGAHDKIRRFEFTEDELPMALVDQMLRPTAQEIAAPTDLTTGGNVNNTGGRIKLMVDCITTRGGFDRYAKEYLELQRAKELVRKSKDTSVRYDQTLGECQDIACGDFGILRYRKSLEQRLRRRT